MSNKPPTAQRDDEVLTDNDEEAKIQSVTVEEVHNYEEFDSEEEVAFGTTVSDSDYMNQYKKHNRNHTKNKNDYSLLSSPQKDKEHVRFTTSGIEQMQHEDQNRSIIESTTLHAMAQAAKYYNNMQRDSALYGGHSRQGSESAEDATRFESRTLEYGQPAKFDKEHDQYFADISQNEKRYVLINLHVSRIAEIDTVKERFRCQFWISFSWLPTYKEWKMYQHMKKESDLAEWRPHWIPVITFPELTEQWKIHFAEKPNSGKFSISSLYGKEEDIGYDPSYCKFIRCRLECDITFSTGFLLLNFPVDCQDLPISIHETSGGCIFIAEKRKRSFATIAFVMEEWQFINMVIEIGQLITGNNESSLAQLKVRLKMQRRFEVYLWNVVFFMSLISGLTLCSFAVEDINLGERLAIIITLLLTSVAYQSSVFSTLPNVPYLTLLDKYIVTSFLFMTLVTVETAMLGTKYLDNDEHNGIMFTITSIIFVGYHLIFVLFARSKKKFEQQKLWMSSKTMFQLYSTVREKMEVEWKSERQIGSNWKIYTKHPEKLIISGAKGEHMQRKLSMKMKSNKAIF